MCGHFVVLTPDVKIIHSKLYLQRQKIKILKLTFLVINKWVFFDTVCESCSSRALLVHVIFTISTSLLLIIKNPEVRRAEQTGRVRILVRHSKDNADRSHTATNNQNAYCNGLLLISIISLLHY